MDKLAVELLTLISFFACTDGGPTGCSLALVSKRMNYASRPARFYSVSLINSATQIEQFLACYQAERSRAQDMIPRVRHLCVSLFGKGLETTSASSAIQVQPKSRAEFLAWSQRRAQHWRTAQDTLDEQFNRVIPALIRAVAPDIRTLALMQAQWRSPMVVRCTFPCLEELTLVGGDPSFLPFQFVPSGRPLYPALRRLHHIFSLVNKDVDFIKWAEHAPNLTHLRVSRLDYLPRVTTDTLERVMSHSTPPEVFPHLHQVVIQPVPPPSAGSHGAPLLLSHRDFTAHLQKCASKARVDVLLLPPMDVPKAAPGADPSRGCIVKLQSVWRDRIEGGDGVWGKAIGGCGDQGSSTERSAVPPRTATPLSVSRWTNTGPSVL